MGPPVIASASPIWWNVVFQRREVEHWWDWLSPSHLRHVACYGYVPATGCWVFVDPLVEKTEVYVIADKDFDEVHERIVDQASMIVRIEGAEGSPFAGRLLQTCATVVARVIGRPSAWRPAGLLRHLLREGAEVRYVDQSQGAESRSGDCRATSAS